MISDKILRGYNFSTIDEYFSHITTQFNNGNFQRAETLTKKLSTDQKIKFIDYLLDQYLGQYFGENHYTITDLKSLIKNLII